MTKRMDLKIRMIDIHGSQANFAYRWKKSASVVSEVISGRRPLNLDEAEEWAALLRCKVEDLLGSNNRGH